MDRRGIDVPAVTAMLEPGTCLGELIREIRRQVAEVRVGGQPGEPGEEEQQYLR